MRAGRLRHKIEVQKRNETKTIMGGIVPDFVTHTTCFGEIIPLNGKERLNANQVNGLVSHRIVMRWFPDFTPDQRLKYNGRFFHPVHIINIRERNKEYEVLAIEKAARERD